MTRRQVRWRRLAAWAALPVALAATVALAWLNLPLALTAPTVELSIEVGTTPREVAQAWVGAGVRTSPWLLYQWFRLSGDARRIRAGSYAIDADTSPRTLLALMVQRDEAFERVRLIEGWTWAQVRAELARAPLLAHASAGMDDARLMAALGLPARSPEGRFYPDTYLYTRGVSDLTVLRRAAASMARRLASAWAQRSERLALRSADEALILASIIEKETALATDRSRIAAVFVNRLQRGMPLQTDPTVIYGLGAAFDGNLRKRDLLTDTPFNTYTRTGLPPTPIALPGQASIDAALHPDRIRALYFVSRGDGTSVFSDDLAAHNRAVNQFQRGRR